MHGKKIDNQSIKRQLYDLAEPKFQKFSSALIPNIPAESMVGVRLPKLRKIAKEIAKGDWRSYLTEAEDESFEEIMLQGMVIGYASAELDEQFSYIERFIPKINNWSVCDSFCSGLKMAKNHPREVWEFIQPYLKDNREYHIRFGVVMLLFYYVDEPHVETGLQLLEQIQHEAYYVKMAVAWAISIYFVNSPEITLKFLKQNRLDDITYNTALRKIVESRQVEADVKAMIKTMKRI